MTEQGVYSSQTRAPVQDASSGGAPSDGHEVSLIDVLTQLGVSQVADRESDRNCHARRRDYMPGVARPVYGDYQNHAPPANSINGFNDDEPNGEYGAGSLAAVAGGGLGLKNPNDIYVGLLNSRPVADAIIQQFDLANVYHAKDMTAARKRLASYTEVVSEKNGFIAVSVTDKDKRRVAEMANAYTDELRILTKTLAVTEASQRRLFYEDQLKQAKEALFRAEVSFQQVQQSKGLVQLDAQAKAMIESLAVLRAQVAAREVEVRRCARIRPNTIPSWNWRNANWLRCGRGVAAWSSATTLLGSPTWGWEMFRAPAWSIFAPSTN